MSHLDHLTEEQLQREREQRLALDYLVKKQRKLPWRVRVLQALLGQKARVVLS